MQVNRTTEAIRFDTGISMAEYAEGAVGHSARTQHEQSLLPGATTVSEALASIFPDGHGVFGEIMNSLVAGNPALLRTSAGFSQTARETMASLRRKASPAAQKAADEIAALLADNELMEQYRSALLES
ncbi:MAG: hypothetical protein J6Y80_00785 [Victivallales bacterium]|nr:hypothetical protein [Victivallales bacterium]